ncbi:hypothetical protein HYPSUDRAFT_256189 [Hypholoma sublateritium FD-334 SS-4]|uniref:Uncharacterized protein n=1 Tax=Hypholoma sublateritium (strain FD-334 SS-4) TaxID=945553 RepID=A0A0D2N101_HYPSF|nr:hypothetical protein HYPSUDRAFT_256189 [Hypholoma sublateritium FD-334 SS-4]
MGASALGPSTASPEHSTPALTLASVPRSSGTSAAHTCTHNHKKYVHEPCSSLSSSLRLTNTRRNGSQYLGANKGQPSSMALANSHAVSIVLKLYSSLYLCSWKRLCSALPHTPPRVFEPTLSAARNSKLYARNSAHVTAPSFWRRELSLRSS